jgi:hypothetical protein
MSQRALLDLLDGKTEQINVRLGRLVGADQVLLEPVERRSPGGSERLSPASIDAAVYGTSASPVRCRGRF